MRKDRQTRPTGPLLAVSLGLLAIACEPGAARTFARDPLTLIVARTADARVLDPARASDSESVEVTEQIYDKLLAYNASSGSIEPALAESWKVDSSGTVWTFRLREGVVFHDGTPLDAAAVAFSFERQRDSNHPFHQPAGETARFTYWASTYQDIEKVEAVGQLEVRIIIKRPFAPFEANLTMFPVAIVSPTAVAVKGAGFSRSPVGTGPYRFREWSGDRIVLERNLDYWGELPKMNRLIFQTIRDPRQRLVALESGAVDVVYQAPAESLTFVDLHPDLATYEAPVTNIAYLAMNTSREPWGDLRVRRALNHAIDRRPIVKLAYHGLADPATGPLPTGQWGYHRTTTTYDYDPDKARELLADAVSDGAFDLEKTYTFYAPLTPRPYVRDPEFVTRVIIVQLEAIGLTIKPVVQPFADHLRSIRNAEHDLCLNGWVADNSDPDNTLFTLFNPENTELTVARNLAFYRDNELHQLLLAARALPNRPERDAFYARAQERIVAQAPWVPLAHSKITVAARADLEGVVLTQTGHIEYGKVVRRD